MTTPQKRKRETAEHPKGPRSSVAAESSTEAYPTTATLASQAKDLDALRGAVVDAASVSGGLWLSYLFVLFYFLIAVGGVTHRDLFFENPVKLPFLNVDLPLTGFFVLGPGLFVVVHAYVLIHFVLLAGKIGAFHAELQTQITDRDARARLRRQLPSNIFVQLLAGPREIREGVIGGMLQIIALITLAAGPIALLVFFQLQFLPYHNAAISWWQRLAVLADLLLLWTIWPLILFDGRTKQLWHDFPRRSFAASATASVVTVLLIFTIATFPGEWLDRNPVSLRFVPTKWPVLPSKTQFPEQSSIGLALLQSMDWKSLHQLLVAGDVDLRARRPRSLWSNRLVLPGLDVIDHGKFDSSTKIEAVSETASLRFRDLQGAVLIGANLRKADFTVADLRGGALFDGADLRDAKFDCAPSKLDADFDPNGDCAHLSGARLVSADLKGASFKNAHLEGAVLDEANLQGASFAFAHLEGASITNAHLEGALFDAAHLDAATVDRSHLETASFVNADFIGTSVRNAFLQGVSLERANVQGANFSGSNLESAWIQEVLAWRADFRGVKGAESAEVGRRRETICEYRDQFDSPMFGGCTWSADDFEDLKHLLLQKIPSGPRQKDAMDQVREILDVKKPLQPSMPSRSPLSPEDDLNAAWQAVSGPSAERSSYDSYQPGLAEKLKSVACAADGAPYVIRAFITRYTGSFNLKQFSGPATGPTDLMTLLRESGMASMLARAYLDGEHCPGASGVSESEKLRLRDIRNGSPEIAPPEDGLEPG